MGDEQRVGYEELLADRARGASRPAPTSPSPSRRSSRCSTRRRSSSSTASRTCRPRRRARALEPNLVGELIASEVEVKTGTLRDASPRSRPRSAERRAQLQALVDPLGIALGATGTHPWAPWQEQRIIDTPHYRRNDELLRYVVWRNNTLRPPRARRHPRRRPRDRGRERRSATCCPSCSRSRPARPSSRTSTPGLHSARTQIFTRFFPRCGVPDAFASLAGVRGLRPLPLRDRLGHRAHAALVERPPAPRASRRSRSASATGSRTSPRRSALAAFADVARRADRARARRGRAARRPAAPADRGEHLARDPLRPLRRAASTSSAATSLPARARLERLLEWVAPGRRGDRRGAVPRDPGARTRPSARSPASRRARRSSRSTPSRSGCRSVADEHGHRGASCSRRSRS